MQKSPRTKAEEQFAAIQKKHKQGLKEKERAIKERAEHTAKLRALRLEKEAAEKEAPAEKAESKNKKSSRMPQAHRR